jgi:hypothetical protein
MMGWQNFEMGSTKKTFIKSLTFVSLLQNPLSHSFMVQQFGEILVLGRKVGGSQAQCHVCASW